MDRRTSSRHAFGTLAIVGFGAALLLALACAGSRPSPDAPSAALPTSLPGPTLILVSFDGYRWDYPELHAAPELLRLAAAGVRAERLIPSFPTKTFPNHYTLVTGLYPEHHGIIANSMWDPEWQAAFSLSARNEVRNPRWWEGEPLWVTAERQGRRTAAFFWPGSEAPIGGVRPSRWKVFDSSIPGAARVSETLAWLDLPASERPSFIASYFEDVDNAGHDYGPESPETGKAVVAVDGYLGQLLAGLEARGLEDRVTVVVTSDHGMTAMDQNKAIVLEDLIDLDSVRIVDLSPVAMLEPKAGREEAVYRALHGAHAALTVYRKEEVPERLHFRDHRRIPKVIACADPGWTIYATRASAANHIGFARGMHGFDNHSTDMHGILVARGPTLRAGLAMPALENVHVYELMTRALGLAPAPNDGDPAAVAGWFRDADSAALRAGPAALRAPATATVSGAPSPVR